MVKKHLKILIITSIVSLLPILAGLILWNQLPDQIPTHWNGEGEIDGWSSKPFAVFGLPLILLAAHWLGTFCMLADPKRQNQTGKILQISFWIVPVLSIALSGVTYSSSMGIGVRVEVILPLLLGILFVVLGIYMPKCKQNYTIGLKLPWTLHSEENWNRTHRLAGWLWVGGGLVTMGTAFFGNVLLALVPILLMALIPTVYSYILYRKGI